jgi:hypothetical protein
LTVSSATKPLDTAAYFRFLWSSELSRYFRALALRVSLEEDVRRISLKIGPSRSPLADGVSLIPETDGDVVIDAGSAGPEPADNSADPFSAVCAPVRRLRSRFELALANLRRRKGPEARLSLGLLVSQLCDLWRRETGRPVTANPVRLRSYTGRPQSASGCFVCEAVEALQPTAAEQDHLAQKKITAASELL